MIWCPLLTSDLNERLVNKTNEEIADALVQGFIRYAENPTIPKKDKIIERWLQNSVPHAHILLGLSVFLRRSTGMSVPDEALPNCLAAVVTLLYAGDKIPGYEDTLLAWLLHEVQQHPNVVKSVLMELWVVGAENKDGDLPCFYKISHNSDFQPFLASLSADILKAGINEHYDTVRRLVSLLIFHDQHSVIEIGENELAQGELSAELRVIWSTALFVINPSKYLDLWRTIIEVEEPVLWNAIEVIKGDRYGTKGIVSLTTAQRAEIVTVLGQRFPNVGHPSAGGRSSQKPWEATEFIANQISLLAADGSADAGTQLERLENVVGLASYHNLIRHHRAQHEKQQRESSFEFASPEQVAKAILNQAPATPMDLLAYIIDHLRILSREIASTQRERYRAYWNESGRDLVKPKYEVVCSGLLAEDLQNRVKDHGLIVTVEHHMVNDKECDLVVLQGTERLLPIEAKHHYHPDLWIAWSTQLDRLYIRDVKAGGLGIYLVYWSGEAKGRKMPTLPDGLEHPNNATELKSALESLIPEGDRSRLRVVVVDISRPL